MRPLISMTTYSHASSWAVLCLIGLIGLIGLIAMAARLGTAFAHNVDIGPTVGSHARSPFAQAYTHPIERRELHRKACHCFTIHRLLVNHGTKPGQTWVSNDNDHID
ncbi:hypothetical protein F5B22DRAFT_336937 [Xylaria bambusicola]|uniref:uncharacterized protein n=1 Tax=Xylaria bambusicola TaxID=326684 RepID=UPI0020080FC4|nr:uncharacterized protein F5B22DRAFT_336937 [Xylaria bambusicola]KAI0525393.1 hypothetical protein F5B22DRAFT_336937 [Xylaria bambusicola]